MTTFPVYASFQEFVYSLPFLLGNEITLPSLVTIGGFMSLRPFFRPRKNVREEGGLPI